jgi:hypothetical protein
LKYSGAVGGQERHELGERGGYEKDIRDIVEYFERSCHARDKLHPFHRYQYGIFLFFVRFVEDPCTRDNVEDIKDVVEDQGYW